MVQGIIQIPYASRRAFEGGGTSTSAGAHAAGKGAVHARAALFLNVPDRRTGECGVFGLC